MTNESIDGAGGGRYGGGELAVILDTVVATVVIRC